MYIWKNTRVFYSNLRHRPKVKVRWKDNKSQLFDHNNGSHRDASIKNQRCKY